MEKVLIIRYGELYLKGKNRYIFENALMRNIRNKIRPYGAKIDKISGRLIVSDMGQNQDQIFDIVKKIFGISSFSIASKIQTSVENIKTFCETISLEGSFKVEVKRADKSFCINSNELEKQMGEIILNKNANLIVDVHNPKIIVNIDIREMGYTFISFENEKGLGGMPQGTAGRGMLLLSGGIDSPVAGFLMAKRGLSINAVYFHSHPYTSEQALNKVQDLAKIISNYSGNLKLFVVPFTKIQEQIHFSCDDRFTITIMRRNMYRIAEKLAKENDCDCLISGENLAQVASQTVQGITSSNAVLEELPMFRPLISFDKLQTIEIAKKIGSYDTSILPYQDCCTVFVPKNPIIKPTLRQVLAEEKKIENMLELVDECVCNTVIYDI